MHRLPPGVVLEKHRARTAFTMDPRGHRVPMQHAARRMRTVIRALVVADIAFFVQSLWDVGLVLRHGAAFFVALLFGALWGLVDLGAFDLERTALKVRLPLGCLGVAIAVLALTNPADESSGDDPMGNAYWISFLVLSAAWIVGSAVALRVTRARRIAAVVAP